MAQRKTTSRNRQPIADKRTRSTQARRKAAITPVQVITSGTNMRIVEPAKSPKRRASKPKVVEMVGQTDDVILEQVGGFANFIREYAIVGLAVGFIVGQQANAVVKQLVASFVDPLAQIWFGQSLSGRNAVLHHGTQKVLLPWGAFVFTLLDFFLVLITIYLVVKLFKLDKLKKVEIKEVKK